MPEFNVNSDPTASTSASLLNSFNQPLRAFQTTRHAGAGGHAFSLLRVSNPQVAVRALKKAEDSDDIVVRLYECHNSRGKAELTCARQPKSAMLCDLEENEIDELGIQDGIIGFDYKPFEILTIKLRL